MMPLTWQINSWADLVQTLKGLPCLFRLFTGLYCPGCGGTRAVQALLSGQIGKSLYYHPFVLYAAVVIGLETVGYLACKTRWFAGKKDRWRETFGKRYRRYAIGGLVVVMGNWIIKNGVLIILGIEMMS
ncbi:MAG: DUF2752 domain-containing protein [Lachnospiraceae bacterium]